MVVLAVRLPTCVCFRGTPLQDISIQRSCGTPVRTEDTSEYSGVLATVWDPFTFAVLECRRLEGGGFPRQLCKSGPSIQHMGRGTDKRR